MKVLKVQVCTSVPPTRRVMDSTPVVPAARTVVLLVPVSPPVELDAALEGVLPGTFTLEAATLEKRTLDDEGVEVPPVEPVGSTKLPRGAPWKPNPALCPTPRLPFQDTLVAVTVLPDGEISAFQELVTLAL